ncbi:hypothetical protein Tco_1286463, partial [Tanacetum coccineum]
LTHATSGIGGRGGSMARRGGGWLARHSIVSKEGCSGGGLVVRGGKDIKVKKSKNEPKPTRNGRDKYKRDLRKVIKAGSARQQEKKVNEDQIEVKGSIMTSFQKFKGSFGCFESPRTKDVKVRKFVY